ncbi:cysteine--tRNA ligase, partial [Halonatronum saccharophilum]
MGIKIYNTLSGEKEDFKPIKENEVGIYSCGPTVYDYFHIGNARAFIVPDIIKRYLNYRGYKIFHVLNFTDIDDKMIKRANQEEVTIEQLANRFIKAYFEDTDALNIRRADIYPKATEHIEGMIDLVEKLIAKDYAYSSGGDVYFRVEKFDEYGKLSKQHLEDLEAGNRVEVSGVKENPLDFTLWKESKEGEPSWESPWGLGRPGWHIECSVMSTKYLGDRFDIHTGGVDLTFPHHENEVAQSEACCGHQVVNYWVHNGYINIDGEKMSKSLDNFFTIREILEKYKAEVIRFFLISKHYRSPINFSDSELDSAKKSLGRL